jgi:N utilization substance protein B
MAKHLGKIRARRCAVQALYQWQMSGQEPHEIVQEFMNERDIGDIDEAYFSLLIREIPNSIAALERHLDGVLDRPITALDPVERAILAIGVHELLCHPDIPWRVVINEAVELAKMFGAEQSHKYINGVLDKVARSLRTPETRSVS